MTLLIVLAGIGLLLFLMVSLKLNGFIALILVSLSVGLAEGMSTTAVIASVKAGVGGTLGHLALILGFGAMLGRLMADSGAAQRITMTLSRFGNRWVQWAVLASGILVGIPLFFEVGLILMIPIVFTLAATTRLPLLYVGIPLAAALSVTHGFLPPHPGPVAIAGIYKADIGLTLVYGLILGIPVAIIAGPLFAKCLKNVGKSPALSGAQGQRLGEVVILKDEAMPSFWTSILTGLTPVLLMSGSTIASLFLNPLNPVRTVLVFMGEPVVALLISVIIAIFTFGLWRGKKMPAVMKSVSDSSASIAMILLILAGGGAFKQVLVDSGVGKTIADLMKGSSLSPLVLAWSVAAILRIALGSATVAAMTAAGLVLPLIANTHVNPELMVIATGSGSLIFSHVNDPGFWLVKECFNLTIGETLRSWSVMETIIAVGGLVGVLILNCFV